MSYLIDGHNLIPKLPGLSLQSPDDEMQLVERLQTFCRSRHKRVEVFFDQAPPGFAGARRFGPVTARFVVQGSSADEAIQKRLGQLGKEARNWTVVTSDQRVQAEARAVRAQVVSSEAFAREMMKALDSSPSQDANPRSLSEKEIREWLKTFGENEED